jgi:hypothetical protein
MRVERKLLSPVGFRMTHDVKEQGVRQVDGRG